MLSFLAPALLWGTALGSIPLIIHLLNRRRFRRVEWAPMRYLKLTIQRNRRRIQIEELILLLLRIALPILLFLLLARPLLNPTGLEGFLGGGGRSSQVVLVDDSLSMGYSADGPPTFQRARDVAAALLSAARPQDRCTLLTTSDPKTPVLLEVEGSRRDDLSGAALALPQTSTHAAWPSVLEAVDGVLASCTYPTRQLTIVTDLRKSGWDASFSPLARKWSDAGVAVRVVDVGHDESANVALESLAPLDRSVLAGAESRWEATVRNDSTRALSGLKGILRVDDQPTEVALPDIPPHQVVRFPITVRFPGAGSHDLSLELPEDALPGDNRRWASVPVKESLLIRLVDGEPSSEPFGGEADYLAAPLSIGIGDAEAWRVEVVQEEDFLSPRLEPPDVLVMANVAAPTPEQAERLGRMVEDGMGLLIFTGGRIDAGMYNDLLDRDGRRILPARLKGLVEEPANGLIVEDVRPSPLERLLDLKASALERVPVRQIMAVEERPAAEGQGDVRVLVRWNDPARSPAVLERVVGDGRVLLFTTTADRAGNDWPVEPSFVLAIREAVRGTARPVSLANNVTAGEPIRRVVRTSQQVSGVQLTPPGDAEPMALSAVPVEPEPGQADLEPAVAIEVGDTRRAGLYRIAWEEGPLGMQGDLYAANPDARESDLARIKADDLRKLWGPLDVDVTEARSDGSELFRPTGREIWHDLAWGLLGLLVVESMLATWVGRSR
jgi:hypothetical protein